MANFVKFHFFQFVSFQKACEELTISTGFCRSGFAGQEVVIWVICIELFDDVHEQGRNRKCLSSIQLDGTTVHTTYQGGTTAQKFYDCIKDILIPNSKKDDIVIMNNMHYRHAKKVT